MCWGYLPKPTGLYMLKILVRMKGRGLPMHMNAMRPNNLPLLGSPLSVSGSVPPSPLSADIKVSPYTRIIGARSNAVSGRARANTISRKPAILSG